MRNEKGHIPYPNSTPSEKPYRFGADGNLRMYSYDRLFFSLYGYDGGTTRTYKYSMDLSPNWVNGRLEAVNFSMHNAMFYPNSYLNFNANGYYTKHYYNGMERIASRLGDNNLSLATHDPELQDRKWQLDSNIRRNIVGITGYEFLPVGEEQTIDDPKPIFELPVIGISNLQPSSDGIYYYHPNHLGSTCYVTDENASVVQGFLYAPFGEITNEYNSSFGNNVLPKYSFNAKELDEETGMYYYEARYMAPPVFISRDRLFEKYPFMSPYAYCMNNPIKYIDPSGDSIIMSKEGWEIQKQAFLSVFDFKEHKIPFVYNSETGKMDYEENTEFEYSDVQQEIIEHYKVLCTSDYNVKVHIVDYNEEFESYTGKTTLEKEFSHGVTLNRGSYADVYINRQLQFEWDGIRRFLKTPDREDYRSIAILHEIGGHAYYHSQNIHGSENNRLTTEFENKCRSNFTGIWGDKRKYRKEKAKTEH